MKKKENTIDDLSNAFCFAASLVLLKCCEEETLKLISEPFDPFKYLNWREKKRDYLKQIMNNMLKLKHWSSNYRYE